MFGAWTDGELSAEDILLRTKYDLEGHEARYEYLTETVLEGIVGGEGLEVSTEVGVPRGVGKYWGCFKVVREAEREFYCAFRCVSAIALVGGSGGFWQ
jgi:hypothetical protein